MQHNHYLGFGHIHNVLVSLRTLHDIEAITVQHLGLCIARNHQDDVTSVAVLQGRDLMAERSQTRMKRTSEAKKVLFAYISAALISVLEPICEHQL